MPTALNLIASVLLAADDKCRSARPEQSAPPVVSILVDRSAVLSAHDSAGTPQAGGADRDAQNLKKNDRVVTIGGIYGTVVNVQKDLDEVTIKVDENTNTKLRMQRAAIARVIASDSAAPTKTD